MLKFVDLHLLNTNRCVIVKISDIKEVLEEGIKTVVKLQDETSYDCHEYDFKRLRAILMEEDE
jgi:predicted AAA+ superfamily ATPase